jgi:hypothetical protein
MVRPAAMPEGGTQMLASSPRRSTCFINIKARFPHLGSTRLQRNWQYGTKCRKCSFDLSGPKVPDALIFVAIAMVVGRNCCSGQPRFSDHSQQPFGNGFWTLITDHFLGDICTCASPGSHSAAYGIRARSENDRDACAEDDSGRIRLGQKGKILGQHVAGLEIGHE